jgi:hypothetical protein
MRPTYQEIDRFEDTIAENKVKLNKVFKLLREAKLIARQSFGCCGSCGSYEIGTHIEGLHDKNKPVTGYVFYNRQSAEDLVTDHRGRLPSGKLYISFADASTNKYPDKKPVSTLDVGKLLAGTLAKVGLSFEWDGTEDKCVIVNMAEKTADKVEADTETWGE